MTYQDFTLKARLRDRAFVEERLLALGFTYIGLDEQRDTYFLVSQGKLKLRQGTIENLITHYERLPDRATEKTVVYVYDLNPSAQQIADLYAAHEVVGIVEKSRRIYRLGNVKVHLDTTADQTEFLEIEVFDHTNTKPAPELEAAATRCYAAWALTPRTYCLRATLKSNCLWIIDKQRVKR
ncbi:class IV adenylate cyclase [Hymenobacter cellulosilyticus]|uniref:Class IV adenylate cyclase n=1 Tax=Hymenobacter cellulosilyticus TaxID=2932248 RepID=A0A8T9QBH7_9BACT|nr:class IV adenylate cyclase [Hymenobacter cellulosilyticus]UOQ73478.1 class IV adenylate cyclase [Hymenobacter cellulosilyticus]